MYGIVIYSLFFKTLLSVLYFTDTLFYLYYMNENLDPN
jgi:hypothetical protein